MANKFEREWDKFGIRMDREGKVKGFWLVHHSSPKIGFSCFDNENSLVWIVKTENSEDAIRIVDQNRLEILAKGLWGEKRDRLTEIDNKMRYFYDNFLQTLYDTIKFVEQDEKDHNTRFQEVKFLIFKKKVKLHFGIPHQQVKNILLDLKKEYSQKPGV